MSGLESMSALSEANAEAECRQKLQSPEFWRRLELYRLASSSSRDDSQAPKLAAGLLEDVEPRLLFLAVDAGFQLAGDEAKRKTVESVLVSVFGSSVGPELLQNNSEVIPFFLAGLCHPTAGVKILTARTLVALGVTQNEGRRERCRMLLQPPLLPAVVAVLGDGDTGAAQAAADAIVVLCKTVSSDVALPPATVGEANCIEGVMQALSSQITEAVAGLPGRQASTPRLRYADTAARLMAMSESAFSAALNTGAVCVVTDLTQDSSDILVQLNALELLEQVATTAGGARYLVTGGLLNGLLVAAGGGQGERAAPQDPFLGASALRTVANVLAKAAGIGVDVWSEGGAAFLAGFLRACTVHMEGRDEAGKLAGFVAASAVAGASSKALEAMLSQEYGSEGVLDVWLTLSRHKVEVKAAALHAVASVLGPLPSTASTGGDDEVMGNTAAAANGLQRSLLVRQFFERMGKCNRQPTGALLVGLARQPVPEIRHAAYDVLRCTVWQPGGWGVLAVFSQPGFREFLEDRDTEMSKVSKEWRFSVIEAVMGYKDRGILGEDTLESFRNILKQGPFWVPAKTRNVATLE